MTSFGTELSTTHQLSPSVCTVCTERVLLMREMIKGSKFGRVGSHERWSGKKIKYEMENRSFVEKAMKVKFWGIENLKIRREKFFFEKENSAE